MSAPGPEWVRYPPGDPGRYAWVYVRQTDGAVLYLAPDDTPAVAVARGQAWLGGHREREP
jgi:hypothetical protein